MTDNFSETVAVDNLTYDDGIEDVPAVATLLEDIIITCVASFIIFCTVSGNILVIVAVLSERRLRKVGNSFIVSLALSDLLVGLVVAPFAVVYHLQGGWFLGEILCDVWISLDVIACTASIVNLCVISFDRYNAITQPLRYARKRTARRAAILIALLWFYSIGIAVPPLLGWGTRDPQPFECIISQDEGYTIFSTVGAFYLPLTVMLYLYGRVYRATLKRKREWIPGPGSSQVSVRINKMKTEETSIFVGPDDEGGRPKRRNAIKKRRRKCKLKPINPLIGQRLMQNGVTRCTSLECLRKVLCNHDDICPTDCHHSSPLLPPKLPPSKKEKNNSSPPPVTYTTPKQNHRISFQLSREESINESKEERFQRIKAESININVTRRISRNDSFLNNIHNALRKRISNPELENSVGSHDSDQEPAYLKLRVRKLVRPRRKGRISILQERRAAKTLGIVMGCFIFCWLPFFIQALVLPMCRRCGLPRYALIVISWLGWGNSMLNPVIYTFFNQDFRNAFKSLMNCTICQRRKYSRQFFFR